MGSTQASEAKRQVGGSAIYYVPGCLRSRIIWSIGEAERLKGAPVMIPEILAVFYMSYTKHMYAIIIYVIVLNLYRDDEFYADKEFSVYSLSGPDGTDANKTLEKFSDRFLRLYPGY